MVISNTDSRHGTGVVIEPENNCKMLEVYIRPSLITPD